MGDRIFLDDMRLKCRIGISDEERREPQEVMVDISLITSLKRAGTSDDLDETVNYKEAMQRIAEFVSNKEFKLIEGLAEGIASLALEAFDVDRVIVKVRKAKYSGEPSIGIEIARDRGGRHG